MNRRAAGIAVIVVVVLVVLVEWNRTPPGSTPVPSTPSTPAQGSAARGPSASPSVTALRSVHTPAIVVDDMKLTPGQCHRNVLDATQGLVLPDRNCTPGATDPAVTQDDLDQTICRSGYTATVRPTSYATGKAKDASLAAYGMQAAPTIEYDHLVSLELGGASTTSNLWPEPNDAGASGTTNPKDAVETRINKAVCTRQVTLAAAQRAIATDWTTAEKVLGITR